MHLVLDPRAVSDNLVAPRHQPPEAFGIGVGQPDLRQEIGRPQRRQHAGIDLVRLDVRVGDRLDLQRIGHDDARHMRRKHADHGHGITGRLDDDLVLLAQATAETLQPRAGHADASGRTQRPVFPEHHLCKGSVDVHANHTSHSLLLSFHCDGSSGQHDNYGSALSAQPGRSQGRPATNASSRLMMYIGLPTQRAPGAPRPGWSHHTPGTTDPSRASGHRDLHTGCECYRGAQFQAAPGGQGQRPLSQR
jgi:hypothetical protein